MNQYNNIPKAIREGIFCIMTGTAFFLGNGITADAAEEVNSQEPIETEAFDSDVVDKSEAVADEAKDLIDLPQAPVTESEPVVENTQTGTTTEVTRIYVEETENAVATTTEKTVEVVNNPEVLTKDEENAIVTKETTEVVNDEGSVTITETTTTTGEYKEPVSTKETTSVTSIATSSEDLAKEIISQVEEAQKNNTEDEGVRLDQVSENTFIDNGKDGQIPVALTDEQAAELADLNDGEAISVDTTDGKATISVDNKEIQLSDDLKDIIVDSAKHNVIAQSTTYSINGKEISEDTLGSLELESVGNKVDFIVEKDGDYTTVSYVDASGKTNFVKDASLKKTIIDAATVISSTKETQQYSGLIEYKNADDPDLIKEKEGLETIGYTNIRLEEGTELYVQASIKSESYKTETEASARKAELEKDGYTVSVKETDEKYTVGSVSKGGLTKKQADKMKADLESKGYKVTVISTSDTYVVASESKSGLTKKEADDAKAELEKEGYSVEIKVTEKTYVVSRVTEEGLTKDEAKNRKAELEKDGYEVELSKSDETYGVTVTKKNLTKGDLAKVTAELDAKGIKYTLSNSTETYNVTVTKENLTKDDLAKVTAELDAKGIKYSLSNSAETYNVTVTKENLTKDDLAKVTADLDAKGIKYTLSNSAETYFDTKVSKPLTKAEAELLEAQLKKDGYDIDYSYADEKYELKVSKTGISKEEADKLEADLKKDHYVVSVKDNPESLTVTYDLGYCTESQKAAKIAELEAKGYAVSFEKISESSQATSTAFDGYSRITEEEYNRIKGIKTTIQENGQTIYVVEENGIKTYYKLYEEIYTIIANEGNLNYMHQEGNTVIAKKHLVNDNHDPHNNGDPAHVVNYEEGDEYSPDFAAFENEMNALLSTKQTTANTKEWRIDNTTDRPEKHKIEITEGGTYYIDGTVPELCSNDGFILLKTSDEVTIILYNDNGDTVTVPIVTTLPTYQPNQTKYGADDFGSITPRVTFVTNADNIVLQSSNTVGNIIAPTKKVLFHSGNFSGTIICNEFVGVWGIAEGHKNDYGKKVYYVDTRIESSAQEAAYALTGKIVTKDLSAVKTEQKQILTAVKQENKQNLSYETPENKQNLSYEVKENKQNLSYVSQKNKQNLTAVQKDFVRELSAVKSDYKQKLDAVKEANMFELSAEKLAKKLHLVAERQVREESLMATLTRTDYSRTETTLDRTFAIAVSRYSIARTGGRWTETTTVEIPPTPPTPPTPPVVPDIPPVTPPVTPDIPVTPEPPTPPVIIIDDDTPLAQEVAQVLGARRTGPAVLGARRGRTGDMSQDPLFSTLIIMGASATALGVLAGSKKKEEDEEE